jgi:hypothetical protein
MPPTTISSTLAATTQPVTCTRFDALAVMP